MRSIDVSVGRPMRLDTGPETVGKNRQINDTKSYKIIQMLLACE